MLYDIEIICAQLNLELVTTPVKENGEYSLEDIRLFKTLYFDGLTKQSFFDSLIGIFNCFRLIVAKFDIIARTGTAPVWLQSFTRRPNPLCQDNLNLVLFSLWIWTISTKVYERYITYIMQLLPASRLTMISGYSLSYTCIEILKTLMELTK